MHGNLLVLRVFITRESNKLGGNHNMPLLMTLDSRLLGEGNRIKISYFAE